MLAVLSVSHHDLKLSELSRILANTDALQTSLDDLTRQSDSPVNGAVLLATCNRLEIYLDAIRFHDAIDDATAAVATTAELPLEQVVETLRVTVGTAVAAHLFTVAAGLDAMVIGETQISRQVADALRRAQQADAVGSTLNKLFQSASHAAKRVASRTRLGAVGRSVASVALDVAGAQIQSLAGARALVIGTGAYARVVLAALEDRSCTVVDVFSPGGRAAKFAARHSVTPVPPDGLAAAMVSADIVVACSGTGHTPISGALLAPVIAARGRTLVIVDLALRPDVADGVANLDGVTVINLRTVAANAGPDHADAVAAAQAIVTQETAEFEQSIIERRLDPAVAALRRYVSNIATAEVERLRAKYPASVADDVELALHRITQLLLHKPSVRAHELAKTDNQQSYMDALCTLFGIDVPVGIGPPPDR